jgi:arylsulfatase A-like enzyme
MKTLSLFLVLAFAKTITLAGRDIPLSLWSVPAYLWQDALVAVLFGGLELATNRKPWVSWVVYAAIVAYSALNVPLVRVLSSPLTWQMSRAAGGALADSIAYYFSLETFGCFALVIGPAATLPFLLKRASQRTRLAIVAAVLASLALGPIASGRVETSGLERNALATFVRSIFPRVAAKIVERDWRHSPFETTGGKDLSRLRGAAAGRNVVLILLESTGAQYLRSYGADEDPMPNLSRLAEHSILFENAYAVYPESIKGLFSVLCSRYPAFDTASEDYEQDGTPSLARLLAEAGYRTGLFHSGRFAYLGMESIIRHRGYELLEDAGAIGGEVQSSFGVDEPATVKRMLTWLDSLPREQRFFLTYLPIAGHHPYDSPEPGPFAGSDERAHYLNALYYGDRALGQFIDGLKSRGLDTNTLFLILGDHGEAFGQHEGNYGHTLFVHEENVRVPCLIADLGRLRQELRVAKVVSLIDTAPTILELLNMPVPVDWQGTSWLDGESRMALFYTDYSLGFLGLRDGPWKFIYEMESGRSRLFHLPTDPAETRNVAANDPDRVASYRDHLKQWSAMQKGHFVMPRKFSAVTPTNLLRRSTD